MDAVAGPEIRDAPLTAGQRLLLMMEHYRAATATLSCPVLSRIRGPLDTAALGAALDALVRRHEALRTTFRGRGPHATQQVHPPAPVVVRHVDLTMAGAPAPSDAIATELRDRIDVTSETVRATLWRTSGDEHVLCLNMHHLVTDAWSCGILFRELGELYHGHTGGPGVPAPLTPAPWQYRHFVDWQNDALRGGALDRQRSYWRRKLDGARPVALPRPPAGGAAADSPAERAAVAAAELPAAVTAGAHALARESRTTPFCVLLSAFYALLHQRSGQRDLTVASLFANRSRPESRGVVGFLANMVLLRTGWSSRASFAELVRLTHQTVIGAFAHQELPFQLLPPTVQRAGGGRADDVVFQVMVDPEPLGTVAGTTFELLLPEAIGSRFGVELSLAPTGDAMRALLFHDTTHLDPADARLLVDEYVRLVEACVTDPGRPVTT
jgi:hypothetical protein